LVEVKHLKITVIDNENKSFIKLSGDIIIGYQGINLNFLCDDLTKEYGQKQ